MAAVGKQQQVLGDTHAHTHTHYGQNSRACDTQAPRGTGRAVRGPARRSTGRHTRGDGKNGKGGGALLCIGPGATATEGQAGRQGGGGGKQEHTKEGAGGAALGQKLIGRRPGAPRWEGQKGAPGQEALGVQVAMKGAMRCRRAATTRSNNEQRRGCVSLKTLTVLGKNSRRICALGQYEAERRWGGGAPATCIALHDERGAGVGENMRGRVGGAQQQEGSLHNARRGGATEAQKGRALGPGI